MTQKINYKRYCSLVRTLANNLHYAMGLSWSKALKLAHATIKENADAFVIKYIKKGKKGQEPTVTTRVVTANWTKYIQPKGGAAKPTLFVHVDLQYIAVDKYAVRSAVKTNIIEKRLKAA